jgi:hypothetical protein
MLEKKCTTPSHKISYFLAMGIMRLYGNIYTEGELTDWLTD